ncbi:hypothetical protein KI387_024103, partial [Taxus chinensis]
PLCFFGKHMLEPQPQEVRRYCDDTCDTREPDREFEGRIFMSNRRAKKECFGKHMLELQTQEVRRSKRTRGYENEEEGFGRGMHDPYARFGMDLDDRYDTRESDGDFEGMIFMSNRRTKKECFDLKLFGLPGSYASVVKHVRPGMKLFLFEYERRHMHGVFEATTSGSINIDENAFKQSGRSFPAQVRFRRVWECYPLSEEDFKEAIIENYRTTKEFDFDLSQDQVLKLLHLFALSRIEPQVHETHEYLEDGQDLFPGSDLQCETANLLQEVGRSMLSKEFGYKDSLPREGCYVRNTIYDISDADQKLASTRELVHNDLLSSGDYHAGQAICEGDCHAGQTVYDMSDVEQTHTLHSETDFTYA